MPEKRNPTAPLVHWRDIGKYTFQKVLFDCAQWKITFPKHHNSMVRHQKYVLFEKDMFPVFADSMAL